jgi:histone deacetylase HOS3
VIAQNADKKPPVTAASVARDYFQKEIVHHESTDCDAKTVMLIHDSCYGHRYSRPRTSKSLLSTIVERPERIHASILGLSAAYVRMGGRHAGGLAPPHPDRDSRPGIAVPFKICKTSRSVALNSAAATHVHGQKWMEELQIMCDSAEGKLALNGKELVRPIGYGKDENGNPLPKLHEGDLYLCSESLNALEGCLGGVCDAVDAVFSTGNTRRAFVCIRPPGHHCSSNYPSGFCWINNVHVGITHAAINHGLTHAAIIDFDLHHGDGSQMVAWEHNRKALNLPKNAAPHKKIPIGYFSLHDINSYPCEMSDEEKVRNASLCIENAHGQSIWNVHLEPWKTHADFWHLYESKYTVLIEKTRSFLRHHTEKWNNSLPSVKAKAAIFLSAGFDASEWEGEGMQRHKVNVPTDFYARFTADVVRLAEEEGLGVDGRIVSVLEGGYSGRALTSGVLSHICGLAQDSDNADNPEPIPGDGLSTEMRMKLGMLKMDDKAFVRDRSRSDNKSQFDAEWWNLVNLESLEALVNPNTGQPAATKVKDKTTGNYSSPTQASTAKMTDHARVRRSLSGQLERMMSYEPEPIPPPPEVDWATAAYELSRLLIPGDRQTLSCSYDKLNAEATRVRRERQSTIGLPTNGEQRMQLRDRKAKPSSDEEATKPANRRKTIAAVGELPDPHLGQADGQADASNTVRPRRRSSGASSVLTGFQNMQIGETSSRASSVMSEKPKKATVNVKKARVVPAPKAPKKANGTAPPVPRVPSAFVAHRENMSQAVPNASEVVTDGVQSSAPNVSTVDELDGLSSGMKKMSIKLKVPSPEENAARERRAAAVKKPRPKKPALPKVPKTTAAPVTSKVPVASVNLIVERDSNGGLHGPYSPGVKSGPTNEPPPVVTTPLNEVGIQQSGVPISSSHGVDAVHDFVPPVLENLKPEAGQDVPIAGVDIPPTYQSVVGQRPPEEQPQPFVFGQPTSFIDVPQADISDRTSPHAEPIANIDADPKAELDSTKDSETAVPLTPGSAKRTKADLPVFTSSSPIPFGRPVLGNLNKNLQNPPPQDVSQQGPLERLNSATTNTVMEIPARPAVVGADDQLKIGSDASEASGPSRASEASIWDVPETPQRRLV